MSAAQRLAQIAAEVRAHRGCGFEPCETATNPVPGEGSPEAEIVLLGEAPGSQEDREGRPFVGPAGKMLDALLESAGLERDEVYLTNVLKSRPPGNRDPKPDEILHSWPWLAAELEAIRPVVIVPLGKCALDSLAPGRKISRVHGEAIEHGGRLLYPLYHPAAVGRFTALRGITLDDIARLPELLEHARPG
jgi:uracil-DNA glycosylase family 4